MRKLAATAACGLLFATTGCVSTGSIGALPECTPPPGRVSSGAVLMAQSVPSAAAVPCLRFLPVGWRFDDLEARDGEARFWLDSDRDGNRALTVDLSAVCDVVGATQIPSDDPDILRYERVTDLRSGYRGMRYHVYAGGCTTYIFDLHGPTRAEPVAAITQALAFVSREELRLQVRDYTDGRLKLDPEEKG